MLVVTHGPWYGHGGIVVLKKMTVAHDWYDNDTMIFVEGLVYNR